MDQATADNLRRRGLELPWVGFVATRPWQEMAQLTSLWSTAMSLGWLQGAVLVTSFRITSADFEGAASERRDSAISGVRSVSGRRGGAPSRDERGGSVGSQWVDRWVRDTRGASLGVTVAVVCDPVTDSAVWLAVYTGLPTATVVVVPVCGSSLLGDDIVIAADRDIVLAAPRIELAARLDPFQERLLSEHFRSHAG
jgi:hypothetical protein